MSGRTRERRAPSAAAVAAILFGSGFCALVYQVAWLRLLRLVFGASTAASAAVLAIFMGGLGLGGLVLGRRADRAARPLAFYARLELGITAAAAASPLLIALVRTLYVQIGGTAALGPVLGTIVRLALASLVLGVPTFLMGGTLPAMARAVEHASDRRRRLVALLYGTNTLGAVAGALATTFVTLELLGVRASIFAAAALNLCLALIAFTLACRAPAGASQEPAGASRLDPATATITGREPAAAGSTPTRFVLAAAALVGFAFLLMELIWYRMLAPILGGSSYTFGLILAVALVGIGAGGLLYAVGTRERRPALRDFAASCAVEALLIIAPFALGDRIAVLAMALRPLGDAGFPALAATWILITAIVVLPAAVVAGYQFPLLVAVLGSGQRDVGREIGATYAWNTAGAIAGSIAGGFGLLPLLTAPRVWQAVTGLLVLLALAALVIGRRAAATGRGSLRPSAVALVSGALALALAGAAGPSAFWRHTPIGAGRMPSRFGTANELDKLIEESRRSIVWEAEGVESSVGLAGEAQYIFLINGKADGSALRDAPNMVMSVLIGAALHPAPRRALVIGLGSGQSAGWLAQVPGIERVDVVELEPAVLHVAELCAPANFDVLHNPKIHLLVGDGRELLLTSDQHYDLIFSQPSNPYRAGIASLFSQEFYRAALTRLRPGGLLLQWLQGYEVDARLVASAYATIGSVFPSVESWQVHENDLLLLAGREPIQHRPEALTQRLARFPFDRALDQVWGVEGLEGFYTGYLAGPQVAARLAREHVHQRNTDDRPRMEFGFVRTLGRAGLFDVDALGALARKLGVERPPGIGDPAFWQRVEDMRSAREVAWGGHLEPPGDVAADLGARIRARRAYRRGDLQASLARWQQQAGAAHTPLDRLLVAEASAERGAANTPALAAGLGAHRSLEAAAVRARFALRQGQVAEAAHGLGQLFARVREDPWIYPPVLARCLELAVEIAGRDRSLGTTLFDQLQTPFAVNLLEEPRWRTRVRIATTLGDTDRCASALEDFEPHVPWEGRFLLDRYRCYSRAGHAMAARAQRDLQRFLDQAPPRLERDLIQAPAGGRGTRTP